VFEKHHSLSDAVRCTGVISSDCFKQTGVDEDVILGKSSGASFYSPSGIRLSLENSNVNILIVDQKAMEMRMVERAEKVGAEFNFGWAATDVETTPEHVIVTVSQDCAKRQVKARSVILASGFRSKLPQRLGLGINGDFVIGGQVELGNHGIEEVEVYVGKRFAPGFFGWALPTYPGQAMVGVLARHSPRPHLEALLNHLKEQGKVAHENPLMTYGAIPLAPAKRTVASRVMVIGDAAGQVKPTTGGGIRYALLCADWATSVLSEALEKNDLSERSLSRYHRTWRRNLYAEIKISRMARYLYEELDDKRLESLFSVMLRSRGLASSLAASFSGRFDWHSPMVIHALNLLQPWWGAMGWKKGLARRLTNSLRRES
jgi:flavin-dependent dehydrogenase